MREYDLLVIRRVVNGLRISGIDAAGLEWDYNASDDDYKTIIDGLVKALKVVAMKSPELGGSEVLS